MGGVHEREARRLIGTGADPRRAGPAAAAHFGLPRRFHAGEALAIGIVLGGLAFAAPVGVTVGLVGLDPARFGLVRAPQDAPALQSAKAQVEDYLASVPVPQQTATLADFQRFAPWLHDAVAWHLLHAVDTLSAEDRRALAADQQVVTLLDQLAKLTGAQRDMLRGVLAQPERVDRLGPLLDLDPTTLSLLEAWRQVNDRQRQTLAAVLTILGGDGDESFDRLIAAYSARAPSLLALLDTRLLACSAANTRACR